MYRLIFILLTLSVLFSACFDPLATQTEGKLFIIGGGKRPFEMIKRMITESGLDKGGYLVVLPMASTEPDTAVFYAAAQFKEHGILNIIDFRFNRDLNANPQQLDSLRNADLIYITGGDQSRFMEAISGTPVEEAIKFCYRKGGTIAGTSAGAAVMSEKMITGNELKQSDYRETFRTIEADNIELGVGLGLVTSAIIDQHFVYRSRHNRLITAVIENPDLRSIGIDEATAILVTGKTAEVIGESQVLVFENPKKKFVVNAAGKLGAKDLKLHVLLPGDRFML